MSYFKILCHTVMKSYRLECELKWWNGMIVQWNLSELLYSYMPATALFYKATSNPSLYQA